MSQKVSRKSAAISEEKEKKPADSPVKDLKKKTATTEKDKTTDKTEKVTDKVAEKTDKAVEKTDKAAEKTDKTVEKSDKKAEKNDKKAEKVEKPTEKNDKKAEKVEKPTEKKETQQKKDEGSSKEDKNAKSEPKPDPKAKKPQNGSRQNGTNGTETNGVISCDSSDEDEEMFPELAYDDSDDVDFEPNERTSRSYTRRSQVKATRTPETPRPASDKQTDREDDSKETKVIKLKEDATDRKLRSSDSPKPQEKKKDDAKVEEKEKEPEKEDKPAENKEEKKDGDSTEVEIVIEVDGNDAEQSRKTDTNFSKSRVKVSPYRRSLRIQDQTNTSLQANYTGNNTTMEMDITESSITEEADDSYLRGLRTIRGRTSYKPLKEMNLRNIMVNRSVTSSSSVTAPSSRPTGTVVGRKRKPDAQDSVPDATCSKRMRVLDTLTAPFRRVATHLPSVSRHAEIVGINTDLPLTAPAISADSFDPETLKPQPEVPIAVPLPTREERENKRCAIM